MSASVPHPGLHVTQFLQQIALDNGFTVMGSVVDLANPPAGATERQKIDVATAVREINVQALASDRESGRVVGVGGDVSNLAPDCNGPDFLIPPPTCTDEASNQRQLALCQAAWDSDDQLFEGTDRVLTSPLNGETHGMVDGISPINLAPVGGAQMFVDESLSPTPTRSRSAGSTRRRERRRQTGLSEPATGEHVRHRRLVFFGRFGDADARRRSCPSHQPAVATAHLRHGDLRRSRRRRRPLLEAP
jgi:hypothetical protein